LAAWIIYSSTPNPKLLDCTSRLTLKTLKLRRGQHGRKIFRCFALQIAFSSPSSSHCQASFPGRYLSSQKTQLTNRTAKMQLTDKQETEIKEWAAKRLEHMYACCAIPSWALSLLLLQLNANSWVFVQFRCGDRCSGRLCCCTLPNGGLN
jgi:hypothetical protein